MEQDRLEMLGNALPGQALRGRAGRSPEPAGERRLAHQALGRGDERRLVVWRGKERGLLMPQMLARRRITVGDDAQAAPPGFERDVAEGLAGAREHGQVPL